MPNLIRKGNCRTLSGMRKAENPDTIEIVRPPK
jgi:hypothetical protein